MDAYFCRVEWYKIFEFGIIKKIINNIFIFFTFTFTLHNYWYLFVIIFINKSLISFSFFLTSYFDILILKIWIEADEVPSWKLEHNHPLWFGERLALGSIYICHIDYSEIPRKLGYPRQRNSPPNDLLECAMFSLLACVIINFTN